MLWALDTFKSSQAADVKEGDWTLGPVDEARLPKPWNARAEFEKAMDAWDSDAADASIVAFSRTHGAAEVMETFWRYAIRDQRNIGHKAIFAAQCWRTLQAIGWQNAEPVLRSLAFALLDRQGAKGTDVVGPYVENLKFANDMPKEWLAGTGKDTSGDILDTMRSVNPNAVGAEFVKSLQAGSGPEPLWDGILKAANELLLRKPGIVALHAVTSVNALHFIYGAAADESTRKTALLQAASWVAMFREAIGDAPKVKIDALEPADVAKSPDEAIADIFATIGNSREEAARKTIAFLNAGGTDEAIFAAARRMIFLKGRDSHDFKFGAAAWEESLLASSPKTQTLLTAAMMGNLPSSSTSDSPLMIRAREASKTVLG
jgi:hypothetical protein